MREKEKVYVCKWRYIDRERVRVSESEHALCCVGVHVCVYLFVCFICRAETRLMPLVWNLSD
jgi:hypothetical protein